MYLYIPASQRTASLIHLISFFVSAKNHPKSSYLLYLPVLAPEDIHICQEESTLHFHSFFRLLRGIHCLGGYPCLVLALCLALFVPR